MKNAHGGIMAADLAAQGFRGPEYVPDGDSDLRRQDSPGRNFEGSIEIRTRSGQSLVRHASLAGNHADKVREKFTGLVEPILGTLSAHRILDRLSTSLADWTFFESLIL
jgi:hypothetical protein